MTAYYETFETPLGPFTVVVNDSDALITTAFGGLDSVTIALDEGEVGADAALTAEARRQVKEYFGGRRKAFDLLLAPAGSDFQQRYWRELSTVGFGASTTYGELARRLGTSPRAIGRANATNPISLIIPCHRVIGTDGSLTGYAHGLDVKRRLLEHEGALTPQPSSIAGGE